jgi:hypothetical protein
MQELKRRISKAVLCLAVLALTPAYGANSLLTDIRVTGLKEGTAPQFLGRTVLFSYSPPGGEPVQLVGARFSHEDYRVFHPYLRNQNGVFVLLLEAPAGVSELEYRVAVDGLWMPDPYNPDSRTDRTGTVFSVVRIDSLPAPPIRNPRFDPEGSVTFRLRTAPGSAVSLAGDFNHWDPYWDPLRETSTGLFTITLRVPPGRHYYVFIVDGRRVVDPFNSESAYDPNDLLVSTFVMGRTRNRVAVTPRP